ncbi:HAUS augmin-like complex subunit 1 [Gigantopelta aegis]|uniref:HAUS augmin-like complex subunit 1 n=1 Tax=Gigantopelta aegis TaxID=1735272 RepID=UPI001B887C73|nr:HAUS augmin-like complex subunit 1 [Gigantopelta aegis]
MAELLSDELQTLSLNDRLKQVEAWLEQVYGGEEIPAFEVNDRTVKVLYGLMLRNQSQNRNTQLVIDDLRQKTDEYRAEGQRLNCVLTDVNLTPSSLSQSGVMSLRTVANTALVLQTKDASDTSFLLAVERLEDELDRVIENRQMEQQSLARLVIKTRNALHQNGTLHRVLQSLEEQKTIQQKEMQKQAKDISFVHAKARDYKGHIKKRQAQLKASGADPSLYHQTLVSQSQSLQALKEKIVPLKAKLDSYQDLPPNISEASVKIEEVKRQVAALDEELTRLINVMHI